MQYIYFVHQPLTLYRTHTRMWTFGRIPSEMFQKKMDHILKITNGSKI